MRLSIHENSPQRLDLSMTPVKQPAYWFAGILFVAMGLGVAFIMARAVGFACIRAEQRCEVATSRGFGWKTQRFAIDDLQGARSRTWQRAGAAGMRLELLTRGGVVPIDLINATGDVKDSLARVIERFIDDRSIPEVRISEDARGIGWGLGAMLIGAGVFCLWVMEWIRLTFDRGAGVVRLRSRRLRGSRSEDVPLADIESVEMHEYKVRAASYALALRTKNRAEVPLARSPMFTKQSAEQVRALIERWLAPTSG